MSRSLNFLLIIIPVSACCIRFISAQETPHREQHDQNQASAVCLIHEFPKPSWVENLAVMRNGSILATLMTKPQLYMPEVKSYPGSYAVWHIDLRRLRPQVSKIADVPEASFLNGMVYLGQLKHAVLLIDSTLGVVFKLELSTGKSLVAIDDPLMKKCSPEVLEGINDMKLYQKHDQAYLYFSNAYCGFLAHISINPDGTASGASSVIAYSNDPATYMIDDFAVARDVAAYVATGSENVITKVGADGKTAIISGNLNSTKIAEPTALASGRTRSDWNTLYVSTGGALAFPLMEMLSREDI
ncbi:hypothetical protein NA57DRAFT_61595 [Rhizodiscina lignyota]|uniref:Uncharacterized protein n=1 Tax=Rhizodiscina lignyota TaxID=1504668 RepID=A0A9P4I686_9PEZI|nr:hypothetical protein NA57DRAFT_61595 [Rhizodiscina lignyota]